MVVDIGGGKGEVKMIEDIDSLWPGWQDLWHLKEKKDVDYEGFRVEGKYWGRDNVVVSREVRSHYQRGVFYYRAWYKQFTYTSIVVFFCHQYLMWNSKLKFSFLNVRQCIYYHNCHRQQKWICAQIPRKNTEEDSDGRHSDDIQLPGCLAAGHCSDHHLVSCCCCYVWLSGLQKLFG